MQGWKKKKTAKTRLLEVSHLDADIFTAQNISESGNLLFKLC